jgi:hypothetical protein
MGAETTGFCCPTTSILKTAAGTVTVWFPPVTRTWYFAGFASRATRNVTCRALADAPVRVAWMLPVTEFPRSTDTCVILSSEVPPAVTVTDFPGSVRIFEGSTDRIAIFSTGFCRAGFCTGFTSAADEGPPKNNATDIAIIKIMQWIRPCDAKFMGLLLYAGRGKSTQISPARSVLPGIANRIFCISPIDRTQKECYGNPMRFIG